MLKIAQILMIGLALGAAESSASYRGDHTESGLEISVTRPGTGPVPRPGQIVIAHYVGTLPDGTQFDSSREDQQPLAFTLGAGQVIKGWDEAFARLSRGSQATLIIPPNLAYGNRKGGKIPPNSTLRFDVELVDIKDATLGVTLANTIAKDGLDAALKQFAALRAGGFARLYIHERQLNDLGYRYLEANKLNEAVAVLRLNAELYPSSSNVHDSLGEALAKNGQVRAAICEYGRALELDPHADNARKMLEQLSRGASDLHKGAVASGVPCATP